jgi:hypothetical protein
MPRPCAACIPSPGLGSQGPEPRICQSATRTPLRQAIGRIATILQWLELGDSSARNAGSRPATHARIGPPASRSPASRSPASRSPTVNSVRIWKRGYPHERSRAPTGSPSRRPPTRSALRPSRLPCRPVGRRASERRAPTEQVERIGSVHGARERSKPPSPPTPARSEGSERGRPADRQDGRLGRSRGAIGRSETPSSGRR